jgi:hypothetical protein
MMKNLNILLIIISTSYCLKAKQSAFDTSNPVTGAVGNIFLISKLPVLQSSPAPAPAPTPVAPGNTLPTTLTYTGATQGAYKVFQGSQVNFTPTFTGTVQSWSITPDISTIIPGLVFNPVTGAITGVPTNPPAATTTYPSFTITATVATYTQNFPIVIELLGTGAKVWTVINGVSGGDTKAGTNAMKYDPTCNCLYIGGTTTSNLNGQTIPSTGGNPSGFISRYELDGSRKWTRVFGTSGAAFTSVNGITTDTAGNIYSTGNAGIGNFNGINITVANLWPFSAGYIIKFDPNGNLLWTASSAPSVLHYYSGILIDNSGDVIVSGTVVASSIDGMTNTGGSDQAGIVQKFNPTNGNRIAGIIIPGSVSPFRGTDVTGVAMDTTGKIYLGVATRTTVRCGDGTIYWRPALFRFDANMNYLSCTAISSAANTVFGFGATASTSGESYLAGYINGAVTFDGYANIGNTDGYFTKFDSAGTKQWTRRLGVAGAMTTINSARYESSTNNIYITGLTSGNLQGTIAGTRNMFVAKYDSAGNQIWLEMQGITNDTTGLGVGDGTSIAFDSIGTLYTFGDTNGQVNGVSNSAAPNRSVFLVRNVK